MSNIHLIGAHTRMTPEDALSYVLKENLQDVLVIGYDTDGGLVIRSSAMNRKDALWMVENAKLHILDIEPKE